MFDSLVRTNQSADLDPKLRYTLRFLENVGFAGLICILAFHITGAWKSAALSLLTAVALFALGSLAGFILALPRISSNTATGKADGTKEAGAPNSVSAIASNNNLVDISDWITKSILTLSIAKYQEIIPSLQGAAYY